MTGEENAVEVDDGLTEEERLEEEAFQASFENDTVPVELTVVESAAEAEDFQEGFDGKQQSPEVEEEAEAEEVVAEAEQDEPEAQADEDPEPADTALAQLQARVEAQDAEIRRLNGRYGTIHGDLQEIRTGARDAEKAGEVPTKEQIQQAVQDNEAYAKLKENFPDWGEGMDGAIETIVDLTQKQFDVDALTRKIVDQTASYVQKSRIEEAYEGWEDLVSSEKFLEWQSGQPDDVQALARSPRAKDAIKLIDTYYGKNIASQQQDPPANADGDNPVNQELLEAVAPDTTRTPPVSRQETEEELFLRTFENS